MIANGEINAILAGVYDKNPHKADMLVNNIKDSRHENMSIPEECGFLDMDSLMDTSDIIVECASQEAVHEWGETILEHCNLMIMSVGALLDASLLETLRHKAATHKKRVYVPSGAIGGMDVLKAIAGSIQSIELTSSKPPKNLKGAPFFERTNISPDIKECTVLYEGNATEAVKLFPANVNVAATVTLCSGLPPNEVMVKIVADPALDRNIHHLVVDGDFGRFEITVENLPSKENPKTSILAALSAITMLKKLTGEIEIGT